jgi:DNA-binding NarL/FixJ family response regulator
MNSLTQREHEILICLSCGEAPKVIATRLGISVRTVYKHIANIYEKLIPTATQQRSHAGLVARYYQWAARLSDLAQSDTE